jgi:predicted transglutaminase-like cysteine proteinase
VALLSLAVIALAVDGAAAKSRRSHAFDATGFGALERIAPPPLSDPAVPPPTVAPARFFTINQVLAKLDGATPPSGDVRLAAREEGGIATDAAAPVAPAQGNEPFGLFTFRAPDGLLWAKWRGVEADLARDAETMTQCRVSRDSCASATARFIALIDGARKLDGRDRLEAVNRDVNAAIRYTSDMAQHGVPDLWSAPLATFTSGRGDCEDYAIAKYVALREAGVAAADLRIVLARETMLGEDHAVLAARLDGRWLILDNRRANLTDDNAVRHLMPLFAVGQRGVQMFAAPYVERAIEDAGDVAPATAERNGGSGGAGVLPVLM